ncbi:MAG: VWA domain-containing protein [Verrucomicrobia bacterium]|nr:VWA domain-containing protein [Verrucomicrobiota bacterium]
MILNLSRQILFQSLPTLIIPVLLVNAQDARGRISATSARPPAMNVVVPQARFMAAHPSALVQVTDVEAGVEIVEQVATTTMQINLINPSNLRQEAELVAPVPEDVALRGFTFQGAASEPTAELLLREEARHIYDSIVAKIRDPALLEFIGCNLIRSSVFPVEARGTQKVRLVYEQVLPSDGGRVDYVLPRSESIEYGVPWKIAVRIRSKTPIATVYSPSHQLEIERPGADRVTARLAAGAGSEPGPFRLSYLLQKNEITASLLAYPDPKVGGGYFLLLAGAPLKAPQADPKSAIKREVTLVLDRSGSMRGEKLEQVREAALQVFEGLEDGEAFNLIAYNETVDSFAPAPVIKNAETIGRARDYLRTLKVRGGTNIHDALVEALRQKPTRGFLPIVLFLTDGLPTVGQKSEAVIRELAFKGNPHARRIFTFGVGLDVNTPLLDKLANVTRATAAFVLPKENMELKVGQVFKRLAGPVLAGPELQAVDADGKAFSGRVRDLTPSPLPDLFEGDQLVLLGRYDGDKPLHFRLAGNYFGVERTFQFRFDLDKATTKNAFIPRLWASRKIALLVDGVRDMDAGWPAPQPSASADPKMKELVDEVVRLSKEFGILTEYTAFLAREGSDLNQPVLARQEALRNFQARAVQIRSGAASLNQTFNNSAQRVQANLNHRNAFLDSNLDRVAVSTVQQVNDRAFYRQGNRWVDSQLMNQPSSAPHRTVAVGSEEFRRLATRLAEQNRQGCVSLNGEILLRVDGETVLVK